MQSLSRFLVQGTSRKYLLAVSLTLIIIAIVVFTNVFSHNEVAPKQLKSESYASYKKGDFKGAADKLSAYLKKEPGDLESMNLLASSYAQLGDSKKALNATEAALKRNPKDPDLLYRAGLLSTEISDYPKAINYLSASLRARPDTVQPHYALANAYAKAKKFDSAISEWNIVLKSLEPLNKQRAVVYASLGELYLSKNDKNKAKNVIEQGLNVDPTNSNLKEYLAKATR
jgi:cytochrome c-type biogenesis protein CcmH/NrfG